MRNKFIYFLLFAVLPLWGQRIEDGEHYFNNAQYREAKEVYEVLLKKKPKDKLLNYRYARCCYELKEIEEAIKHFQTAGENYYLSGFYLGELYTSNYEFDKSIKAYSTYLNSLKENDKNYLETKYRISQCELAERLLLRIEDVAIIDSVVVDKENFLDFYTFSYELGTLNQEQLLFDSLRIEDKIKYITQRDDRVYLSDSINGKMNLFTSYRLLDKWSNPSVLPTSVNLKDANNNYPFLLLDGVTLYFGSDGEYSIGGYDIFITKYISATNSYLTPENIGMPFNSPYNDYMMVIDEVHKVGWFATDRYQPKNKVAIYTFIPNDVKTIIRSEDKDSLRQAAQLKIYRQGEIPKTAIVNTTKISKGEEKDFEFIIYDQLIYTRNEHFKSKEALKKWELLSQEIGKNENSKNQLELLRNEYSNSSEAKRTKLAPQILGLENQIRDGEEKIITMRVDVRNEEIKHLKSIQPK